MRNNGRPSQSVPRSTSSRATHIPPQAGYRWQRLSGFCLVHRSFAGRRFRSFQNLNLAAVMDVLGDLREIAKIKPSCTDTAFFEMIGLDLSDAVAICTGIARKRGPRHRPV